MWDISSVHYYIFVRAVSIFMIIFYRRPSFKFTIIYLFGPQITVPFRFLYPNRKYLIKVADKLKEESHDKARYEAFRDKSLCESRIVKNL